VRSGVRRGGAARSDAWAVTGTARDATDGRDEAATSNTADAATMAAVIPQRMWREGTGTE